MKRSQICLALLALVASTCLADMTPAVVTDPDHKNPQRLDLPRISTHKPVTIKVIGGTAWFEQAVVVWQANAEASMVEVGQVARGPNADGRQGEGGDASFRPLQLLLPKPANYYFACYHKWQDSHGQDVSTHPWLRSSEKLQDAADGGYIVSCSDNNGASYSVVIAVPPVN